MSANPKDNQINPPLPTTRYAALAQALVKAISSGRYAVGSLLPTEPELAELYSVSRHTVRAALKMLQDLGYISRKKSVGTIVESANPRTAFTQSFETPEDLMRVAATEVRSIETVTPVKLDRTLARTLEAPPGSHWIRLSGLRVEAGKRGAPLAWADIYIDAAFAHLIDEIRSRPGELVSTMIERESGQPFDEIRQIVRGVLIDAALARRLKVEPASAGLRLVRHYRRQDGRILEISDTRYPADRVSVSFQLKRGRLPG
ncbi:GntR family transcriptional regulator [Paraburkholderia guartelaensis]|uniref:GntR family transcriptional regulator n=1 Tax=Paraburkholderia guartelaensis TaxID=2546446 RepID=UPI002AB73DCA|nr:GntR family transcriptional regulator [Paraburkholderia guartelaensis]